MITQLRQSSFNFIKMQKYNNVFLDYKAYISAIINTFTETKQGLTVA